MMRFHDYIFSAFAGAMGLILTIAYVPYDWLEDDLPSIFVALAFATLGGGGTAWCLEQFGRRLGRWIEALKEKAPDQ